MHLTNGFSKRDSGRVRALHPYARCEQSGAEEAHLVISEKSQKPLRGNDNFKFLHPYVHAYKGVQNMGVQKSFRLSRSAASKRACAVSNVSIFVNEACPRFASQL